MSEVNPIITAGEQGLEAVLAPFFKSGADKLAAFAGVTDPVQIARLESAGVALLAGAGVVAAPLAQKLLGGLLSKYAPAAK